MSDLDVLTIAEDLMTSNEFGDFAYRLSDDGTHILAQQFVGRFDATGNTYRIDITITKEA